MINQKLKRKITFLKEHLIDHSVLKWLWICSLVICIASWIHYYTAHTIKVDFSSIEPISLRIAVFAVIAFVWTRFCLVLNKVFQSNKIEFSTSTLRVNLYICIAIQFFTLPLFSNDVFSILAYSQALIQGQDIYRQFNGQLTNFSTYINPIYIDMPCMYGPVSVLEICLPFFFKLKSVLGYLFIAKILFLVNAIVFTEVSLRIIKSIATPYKYLILLYPLWIIQGLGQMHNDLLGLTWLVVAVFFMIRSKWILCAIFLTLAILCKVTFIIFTILPLLYLYNIKGSFLKYALLYGISLLVSFLVIGTLFLYPFSTNVMAIFEPINSMASLRPSSTFSDILTHALLVFNSDFKSNAYYSTAFFKYVGLLVVLVLGVYFLVNKKEEDAWAKLILAIFATMIFMISHRFLPWYLMSFPLFIIFLKKDKSWFFWLVVITWISFFQDLAILLNTDFILGQILMVISTIIVVLAYFIKLKERYRMHG